MYKFTSGVPELVACSAVAHNTYGKLDTAHARTPHMYGHTHARKASCLMETCNILLHSAGYFELVAPSLKRCERGTSISHSYPRFTRAGSRRRTHSLSRSITSSNGGSRSSRTSAMADTQTPHRNRPDKQPRSRGKIREIKWQNKGGGRG